MGSVKASINMQTVFGWWDWDAEAPGMVNRVTGERVVYRGRAREEVLLPDRETWLRFDYLHSELTFPLLVQEVPGREELGEDKTTWQLDYRRSAALWRRETGASEPHPSYGVWRRIDDCVSDALACWPENEIVASPLAAYIHFDGGWLNGAWNDWMTRSETRLVIPKRLQSDDEDYNPGLIPLETPPPSPFMFHDHLGGLRASDKQIAENPVLLEGLEFENPEHGFGPELPPGALLTALEGRTAFLLSEDQQRLLYAYRGDTQRKTEPGHWQSWFLLLYVDDRVVFSMPAKPLKRTQSGAIWRFPGCARGLSLRSADPDENYFIRQRDVWLPRPSRPLWLHVRWGLLDGWSAWDGSEARHAAWLPDLVLLRTEGVHLSDGYRGGRWGYRADTIIRR